MNFCHSTSQVALSLPNLIKQAHKYTYIQIKSFTCRRTKKNINLEKILGKITLRVNFISYTSYLHQLYDLILSKIGIVCELVIFL